MLASLPGSCWLLLGVAALVHTPSLCRAAEPASAESESSLARCSPGQLTGGLAYPCPVPDFSAGSVEQARACTPPLPPRLLPPPATHRGREQIVFYSNEEALEKGGGHWGFGWGGLFAIRDTNLTALNETLSPLHYDALRSTGLEGGMSYALEVMSVRLDLGILARRDALEHDGQEAGRFSRDTLWITFGYELYDRSRLALWPFVGLAQTAHFMEFEEASPLPSWTAAYRTVRASSWGYLLGLSLDSYVFGFHTNMGGGIALRTQLGVLLQPNAARWKSWDRDDAGVSEVSVPGPAMQQGGVFLQIGAYVTGRGYSPRMDKKAWKKVVP